MVVVMLKVTLSAARVQSVEKFVVVGVVVVGAAAVVVEADFPHLQ